MTISYHVILNDVTKTYRQDSGPAFSALKGVSLSIQPGERVALIGASGSGKTTILNLIGGLDTPDCGSIIVNGTALAAMSDDALSDFRLKHIGYVFQAFNLLPHLTVEENIAIPLLLSGIKRKEAWHMAHDAARSVEMEDKTHRRPYELSGGEMQRVAIARAIVHHPILLLADEPTGNLDSNTGEVILNLLRRLNEERGVTLLIATHSEQCKRIANRLVSIRDGRILDDRLTESSIHSVEPIRTGKSDLSLSP